MKNKIKQLAITTILMTFSLNVFSDTDEHHHQEDVHVHGAAVLNIVVEDKTILIELESPAMNILGFEHEPKTEEHHAIVKQANEQFKSYLSILSIPDKQCKQTGSELEFAHDSHDDKHHDDHHDKHHDDEHNDVHSEYHLNYTVYCDSLKDLSLDINLFKNFPGFEHVDLNWIHEQKQGKTDLSSENTLVKF